MATVEGFEVLSPGLQTTVQDLGRFGFGRYGVPPSGALDSFAVRIGNLLVDSAENEACLETTLLGLRIRALTDVIVAVTGADLQPCINKQPLRMWCTHVLNKDAILSFAGPRSGCRAYIAFGGGIDVADILGSKSTNLPSGFGGFRGRSLKKGDIVYLTSPHDKFHAVGREFDLQQIPTYPSAWTLRVVWGPQDEDFSKAGRKTFVNCAYAVCSQTDRTGIRLDGPTLLRKQDTAESIISEGVISGSIQVPGDGKPIIILGETVTGGYRKIATVISADLPLLGQIKPGDTVRFKPVSLDQAHQALQDMEQMISQFKIKWSHERKNDDTIIESREGNRPLGNGGPVRQGQVDGRRRHRCD